MIRHILNDTEKLLFLGVIQLINSLLHNHVCIFTYDGTLTNENTLQK